MRNSKYLLLGQNGYLGDYIYKNFDCDVLEKRFLYDNGHKYDFIINCIGRPDINFCETNYLETNYSNADIILDIKKLYPNSKIINFSSYYVYDDEGLCSETSRTTEKLAYSKQKLLSENYNHEGLNFRLGKLFGNRFKNQNKLTEKILSKTYINLDDILFNPVSVDTVLRIIKNENFLKDNHGIFNLADLGIVSHYDYGLFIKKNLELDIVIEKNSNFDPMFESHGKFVMNLDKISKYFELEPWQDTLARYLYLLKESKCV